MSEFRKLTFSFLFLFSVSIFFIRRHIHPSFRWVEVSEKGKQRSQDLKNEPEIVSHFKRPLKHNKLLRKSDFLERNPSCFAFEPGFVGPWRHSKNDHLIYELAQGNFLFILSLTRLSFFALRENQPRCFPDCLSTFFSQLHASHTITLFFFVLAAKQQYSFEVPPTLSYERRTQVVRVN